MRTFTAVAVLIGLFGGLSLVGGTAVSPSTLDFASVTLPASAKMMEPSILVAPDDSLFVAAISLQGAGGWRAGPGAAFTTLPPTGGFGGDTDIDLGPTGALYFSEMVDELFTVSLDGGQTWAWSVPIAPGWWTDRQGMEAWGDGEIGLYWAELGRDRFVRSHDHGLTWTEGVEVGVQGRTGDLLRTAQGVLLMPSVGDDIALMRSADDGQTWTRHFAAARGDPTLDPLVMFPTLAADDDGRLYLAWAHGAPPYVEVVTSADGGGTWSAPVRVSPYNRAAVFAWAVGGAPGRAAIAYLESAEPAVGTSETTPLPWHVRVAITTNAGVNWTSTAVTGTIHTGSICSLGSACVGPPAADRRLGDFLSASSLADGRLVIAYAADRPVSALESELRVATQIRGLDLRP